MQNIITQKRAACGGEIGANGAFYEGGKFIATKDNAKGQPKPRKLRKVELAPYVWVMETPETAEKRTIYSQISGIFPYNHDTKTFSVGDMFSRTFCYDSETRRFRQPTEEECAKYRVLIERFNNGERWI